MNHEEEKSTLKRSYFQPKSYRLELPYYIAFEACANVYGTDKRETFFALLDADKDLDSGRIKELPILNQNILAETMLDGLINLNKHIKEAHYLKNESKVKGLVKYAHEVLGTENEKPLKALRILPDYQEFISKYAADNYFGETLELAIALFINETDDFEYELIETVFKRLVSKEKEKSKEKNNLKFKTYRFDMTFQLLLEVLLNLYGNQKSRNELIQENNEVSQNMLSKYPEYSAGEFVELILDDLKDEGTSINEVSFIMKDPRVLLIKDYAKQNLGEKGLKGRKNLKLMPEYLEYVANFSKNVGDAIEFALALYLTRMDESDFYIVNKLFKKAIDIKGESLKK